MIGKSTVTTTLAFALAAAAVLFASRCSAAENETEATIKKKLKTKVSFEFTDKKLDDAVNVIAKAAKVTITVDAEALKSAPMINLRVTDMDADLALQWMLQLAELDFIVHDKEVFVAKPEVIEVEKKKKATADKK